MHGDVSGVIGLSKFITGNCLVSFPEDMAHRIVSAFLMEEPPVAIDMLHDGIGEVANMVAGGAKRRLADRGFAFSISTPTVVAGRPTDIYNPAETVSIACEFSAHPDWPGTFLIEVATKPTEKE
jgi:chemotaxis protein CheX